MYYEGSSREKACIHCWRRSAATRSQGSSELGSTLLKRFTGRSQSTPRYIRLQFATQFQQHKLSSTHTIKDGYLFAFLIRRVLLSKACNYHWKMPIHAHGLHYIDPIRQSTQKYQYRMVILFDSIPNSVLYMFMNE
jgi:hypothetical protein